MDNPRAAVINVVTHQDVCECPQDADGGFMRQTFIL